MTVAQLMGDDAEADYCAHAAGAAPCADPPPLTAAQVFCNDYENTCGTPIENCVEWFENQPPGHESDTSGATQGCYRYHLNVAVSMDNVWEMQNFCAHAAGQMSDFDVAPCTDPEPVASVTYTQDVQPIFQARCGGCHSGGNSGGTNFASSYAETQKDSYYCEGKTTGECAVVRIKDGSMPMGWRNQVSDSELEILDAWVAAGMPETGLPLP